MKILCLLNEFTLLTKLTSKHPILIKPSSIKQQTSLSRNIICKRIKHVKRISSAATFNILFHPVKRRWKPKTNILRINYKYTHIFLFTTTKTATGNNKMKYNKSINFRKSSAHSNVLQQSSTSVKVQVFQIHCNTLYKTIHKTYTKSYRLLYGKCNTIIWYSATATKS